MTKIYRLLLDACRNGNHDRCATWTHLQCTCQCHQDNQ